MAIDLTRFRGVFFEEAREHLAELEAGLLHLDRGTADDEVLNTIFRAAHSIKGSAGMFGLGDVIRAAHALEGVLDRLRTRQLAPSRPLVDLLLRGSDLLAQEAGVLAKGKVVFEQAFTEDRVKFKTDQYELDKKIGRAHV